ncbi:MAG: hypothetical protein N3A69_15330, partial [Leptospiraceae bacterium]|nr:hypothetical protein [Leptospiraceae bacterium]
DDVLLFGETSCSVIISYEEHFQNQILEIVKSNSLEIFELGESTSNYSLKLETWNLDIPMEKLEKSFNEGLVKYFE